MRHFRLPIADSRLFQNRLVERGAAQREVIESGAEKVDARSLHPLERLRRAPGDGAESGG